VHLDRWWASYPDTHRHVVGTLSREPLAARCILAADATGVGLSWWETFRLDPRVREVVGDDRLLPITITSGKGVSRSGRFLRVGNHRLIAELRAALARRVLRVSKGLPLLPDFMAELDGFEAHVRSTGSLAMGNNPRLAPHDDLVLATALAVVAAKASFGEIAAEDPGGDSSFT
jgi:hypothetical protein